MKLVDSHCHLNLLESDVDVSEVIAAARENGVNTLLNVSVDLESFPEVLAPAMEYPDIYASVGVHPNTQMDNEATVEQLCELADNPNVIAIGETGLDYFRNEGDLEWQKERFRTHIAAAIQVNKPIIVHTRDAWEDTFQIMREEGADQVGGIMHCFTGDLELAETAMALNFHISFSGIVTFNSAKELKQVAKQMPIDRLLIETDSPYLAPVPHRGKTNQPAFVLHVAEHIAELRGVSVDLIADTSTNNFYKLFNILH